MLTGDSIHPRKIIDSKVDQLIRGIKKIKDIPGKDYLYSLRARTMSHPRKNGELGEIPFLDLQPVLLHRPGDRGFQGEMDVGNEEGAALPTITTQEKFDKLPRGAFYMEDGKRYQKP